MFFFRRDQKLPECVSGGLGAAVWPSSGLLLRDVCLRWLVSRTRIYKIVLNPWPSNKSHVMTCFIHRFYLNFVTEEVDRPERWGHSYPEIRHLYTVANRLNQSIRMNLRRNSILIVLRALEYSIFKLALKQIMYS